MMTPTSNGKVPEWLRSRWERTKCETAARVRAAVDQLRQQGRDVTFESIREAIRSLHGVSISANTIKRNELAYKVLPGELQETEDGQIAGAGAQSTGRQFLARKTSRAGSQGLASQA
jgi:hypothetical protein